ncbi:Acetyltransferase (GNAT) domain-containing protein [Loktanella fryxellensis]|uniref:Acetyltransferase (GNAT) domain-containing protein n=1 Tax=Loktanella fryxellensis TaxID=245187 RepID=A0A1H7YGX2_9RHOB|nr:GNAT family N-acetyltransferase [Loktanella fryxellensis]SEM45215.1 Acetyltransferase (GNAT) domain-containing protein [Loktanella fryxellensis]
MLMRPDPPLSDAPLPMQQSPGFARALTSMGHDAGIVALGCVGQVLVVTRALPLVGPVRFASRGPVFRAGSSLYDRVDALRAARLHLVNAGAPGDAVALRRAGFVAVLTPATVAMLPLCDDPDAQLAASHPKWRHAARRGLRARLRITAAPFDARRDGWLLTADLTQQRIKRFRALPHALTLAFAHANPGDAIMLTARDDTPARGPVAAMLILRHGALATYQIGWSDDRGRATCAHHVLLLDATRRLAAAGVRTLDLGTLDTDASPGLARFKLGSGAAAQPLGGTWARVPGWQGWR